MVKQWVRGLKCVKQNLSTPRGTKLDHLKVWFIWFVGLSFLLSFVVHNIPCNQIEDGNPLIVLCNLILEMSDHDILNVGIFVPAPQCPFDFHTCIQTMPIGAHVH